MHNIGIYILAFTSFDRVLSPRCKYIYFWILYWLLSFLFRISKIIKINWHKIKIHKLCKHANVILSWKIVFVLYNIIGYWIVCLHCNGLQLVGFFAFSMSIVIGWLLCFLNVYRKHFKIKQNSLNKQSNDVIFLNQL